MKNKRKFIPLLVAACFSGASAAPTLPQVVHGQATFAQQGNVFSITNTPNTIINWQSFSVNAGEVTRFIQQNANSAVLNRILGQDPSQILGALQSNGHVFLINPNGIMFGKDARIDVGGLTASTLALSNADFLAGKKHFSAGATAGSIVNQGAIATPSGGQVFLIAPNIDNTGIISSPNGDVVLAAGRTVQLVDSSNPDLHVVVSAPTDQAINLGQVIARGGRVGIYGALVNQRGVVNANGAAVGENGKIVLRASRDAVLEAGSVTSATGAGKGGSVSVTGERVALTGDARIDASGAAGGGTVLVGGGYQGKNPLLQNAQQTWLGKDASIKADATGSGDGGTVVLWADGATRAYGQVSARGGASSGNGGMVETSGRRFLDVNGIRVDAGAARGMTGSWLLDPDNIVVKETSSNLDLDDADAFSDPGTEVEIDFNLLNNADANVILQANNNISFDHAINMVNSGKSLTARAGGSIFVNYGITTNGGAVKLVASDPGGIGAGDAGVTVQGAITTNGGKLSLSGGSIMFQGGAGASTGSGDMDFRATQLFSLGATSVLSSGGYVDIRADNVTIGGEILPANSIRPIVSFITNDPGRAIVVGGNISSGALMLAPADLNRIKAHQISIGSSAHIGDITISDDYVADADTTANLVLETGGSIAVNAHVDLSNVDGSHLVLGRFGTAPGAVEIGSSGTVKANAIDLRANNIAIGGAVTGVGDNSKVTITPHTSGASIEVGAGATESSARLALTDSQLELVDASTVQIGGNAGQAGGLKVVGALHRTVSDENPDSKFILNGGEGGLTVQAPLTSDGTSLRLETSGELRINNTVDADSGANLELVASGGGTIKLAAYSGVSTDSGELSLTGRTITNGGMIASSTGDIDIDATSFTNVALNSGNETPAGKIQSASGVVSVTANTIVNGGDITTATGAIVLTASTSLTNGSSGKITSTDGLIKLKSPSIKNQGTVMATNGDIVMEGALTNSGTVTSVNGTVSGGTVVEPPPPPPPAPNVNACLANPAAAGCAGVLAQAVTSCLANPSGTSCSAILALALSNCTANPSGPNCAAVLPTLPACVAVPSRPGCSAVLPSIAACIINPVAPGCSVVLPSLPVCTANPQAPGCIAVLPSLPACITTPTTPGCTAVLPPIAACIANPGIQGCSVVLPTINACIAQPTRPGCTVVLPTVSQCVVNPVAAGCGAVLPSLPACIAVPSAPGCSVVLPSLAQCVTTPSAAGCSAVLPSLGSCTANPVLAGCNAVLPTLAQCVGSPTLQGCSVVLPSVSQCVANPTLPSCVVVVPATQPDPNTPVGQAINSTVNLINTAGSRPATGGGGSTGSPAPTTASEPASGADEKASAGGKGGPEAKSEGVKNETVKKTFCN